MNYTWPDRNERRVRDGPCLESCSFGHGRDTWASEYKCIQNETRPCFPALAFRKHKNRRRSAWDEGVKGN